MDTTKGMSVERMEQRNKEIDESSAVLTGDDLAEAPKYIHSHGNTYVADDATPAAETVAVPEVTVASDDKVFVATPENDQTNLDESVNVIPSTSPNSFVATPTPSAPSTADVVSTGDEGVTVMNRGEVVQAPPAPAPVENTLDQVRQPGPVAMVDGLHGDKVQAITGDNLDGLSSGQRGQTQVGSKGTVNEHTQTYQGVDTGMTITMDHIIRAPSPEEAIGYITKCQDKQQLSLARAVLRNKGEQKLVERVDRQINLLKQRGL
jgi:hypothetical protein